MARNRYTPEQIISKLRVIEVLADELLEREVFDTLMRRRF